MKRESPFGPRTRLAIAAALAAFGLSACAASSQLVNEWKDPEFPTRPMTDVLVVRMAKDEATRRLWEDEMTTQLNRHGVKATPSYREFPNGLPEDKQQIMDDVRRSGYDGVIMTANLPTQVRSQYVPGYVSTVPVTRYNPWYDAYVTHWRDVYHTGYVEKERVVRQNTEVWDTQDQGHLVWTATSETFDPASRSDVSRHIAKKIVPELLDQRVIAEGSRSR
jgi:hypothetical protein